MLAAPTRWRADLPEGLIVKWIKVKRGHYQSGDYMIRQARWRGSPDGWMITHEPSGWHDSRRLLACAKKRCEQHHKAHRKLGSAGDTITDEQIEVLRGPASESGEGYRDAAGDYIPATLVLEWCDDAFSDIEHIRRAARAHLAEIISK